MQLYECNVSKSSKIRNVSILYQLKIIKKVTRNFHLCHLNNLYYFDVFKGD
jgi:hypothetical protein